MSKGLKLTLFIAGCVGAWFAFAGGSDSEASVRSLRAQLKDQAPSAPSGAIQRPADRDAATGS